MGSSTSERKCPDCGDVLRPIKVVTRQIGFGEVLLGPQHELQYSVAEKPSFWTSTFPVEGRLESLLCGSCGRVLFYAQPG
jgi:uncharacterized OB-fold protein